MKLLQSIITLAFGFLLVFMLGSCQQAQSMDPAAIKAEVRAEFEKQGMAIIDSMNTVCEQRMAKIAQ